MVNCLVRSRLTFYPCLLLINVLSLQDSALDACATLIFNYSEKECVRLNYSSLDFLMNEPYSIPYKVNHRFES